MKDSESVRAQQQHHVQQHSCTLDECFELYTKEEQVNNTKTHIILNIANAECNGKSQPSLNVRLNLASKLVYL